MQVESACQDINQFTSYHMMIMLESCCKIGLLDVSPGTHSDACEDKCNDLMKWLEIPGKFSSPSKEVLVIKCSYLLHLIDITF